MDAQWWWLGFAGCSTVLSVSALLRPGALTRGNLAWFACSWLGSEFAAPLACASLVALAFIAIDAGVVREDTGRLSLGLVLVSCVALAVVSARGRRNADRLEDSLRTALGSRYLDQLEQGRRRACTAPAAPLARMQPWPWRPRGVELIADVPYPGGHERNTLDVYRPRHDCVNAPVLLQLHGGSWIGGHKRQQGLPLMHHLAARGWIVVAPNYRLSPGARLPAHLVDCKSALAWVRAHIASLGGDPAFVAVAGDGAGAHLASLLALTFDQTDLQPGFEHVDTRPAACIALHGVYDLADRERRYADHRARLRWIGSHLMPCALERDPSAWAAGSPLRHVRPDAPPFFVLHGTHDSLSHVDEAREFAQRLRHASRSPVAYAEIAGAQHDWDCVNTRRTQATVAAIMRFLEWCAAGRQCAQPPQRDSADHARS